MLGLGFIGQWMAWRELASEDSFWPPVKQPFGTFDWHAWVHLRRVLALLAGVSRLANVEVRRIGGYHRLVLAFYALLWIYILHF